MLWVVSSYLIHWRRQELLRSKENQEQDSLTQEDVVGVTLETYWIEIYLLGELYLRLRVLRMR